MRGKLARALRGPLLIQSLAALLLAVLMVVQVLFCVGLAALAVARPAFGTGPWLAPLALLLVPTYWALGRSLKAANLLWAFGRWQPLELGDFVEADRPWLEAAALAFEQADFERALALLDRLSEGAIRGRVRVLRGRALLWNGRWDEGLDHLSDGGEPAYLLGWLKPRRWLGLEKSAYLGPADAERALRTWPAWVTLALVLAAMAGILAPLSGSIRGQWAALGRSRSFDVSGFQDQSRGRFTVHDHDPGMAAAIFDLADDAMDHDLAFLGRPGDLFGDREIQLFICDDQAEYMKRSPNPVAWEAGCAVPETGSIFLYRPQPNETVYFQVTVAHELGHLIYHRLGVHGRNDAWLNEGLANYLGFKYAFDRNNIPRQAWLQEHEFSKLRGHFIPFKEFFGLEPHQLAKEQDVAVFYEQGSSLVYLLIEQYGRERFLKFLQAYADGNPVERALAMNYSSLPDMDALAAVWGLFFDDAATVPGQGSPGH